MARSSLAALAVVALLASRASAQELSGTWAGGSNATGRWLYVQSVIAGGPEGLRGTLDVPGAQAAGLILDGLRIEGGRVQFRVATPIGAMTFDGTLQDDVIDGTLAGAPAPAGLHLVRLFRPAPAQAAAAVGVYDLDRQQQLLVTYRPFGQLAGVVLERVGGREVVRRQFFLLPVGENRYMTSGSVVPAVRRDEQLALARDAAGAVTSIAWVVPGGASRTATRVAGLRQRVAEFRGRGGRITGTLFLPEGQGPFPAVVLVGGSGPTTRDPFVLRAREFGRLGYAALVYDKRGTGETEGRYFTATFDTLAADAGAALDWLRGQPDIDGARVGMEGHSQGGWIAPLAAARASVPPKWLVVTSGGPVLPVDQEAWRAATQSRAAGASEEEAAQAAAFMRTKWRFGFTGAGWEAYIAAARQAAAARWGGVVAPILVDDPEAWAFIRGLRDFDPGASVRLLTMPVLVLFGDRDDEEPADTTRARWLDAFRQSGHTDHQIVTIPGGTHALWLGAGDPVPIVTAPTEAIGRWLAAHRLP